MCPVDAFHAGPNFLAIDPDVCPAGAIYAGIDMSAGQKGFFALNAELAKPWPVMTGKVPCMPDAAKWDGVPGKLAWFKR